MSKKDEKQEGANLNLTPELVASLLKGEIALTKELVEGLKNLYVEKSETYRKVEKQVKADEKRKEAEKMTEKLMKENRKIANQKSGELVELLQRSVFDSTDYFRTFVTDFMKEVVRSPKTDSGKNQYSGKGSHLANDGIVKAICNFISENGNTATDEEIIKAMKTDFPYRDADNLKKIINWLGNGYTKHDFNIFRIKGGLLNDVLSDEGEDEGPENEVK